jgi:hypothetical protein
MTNGRQFDRPGVYQIKVNGILDRKWSDWFDGFTIMPQPDDETLLVGTVKDQAALHGLLAKIRDLGLPLLTVQRIESEATKT